MFDLSRMTVSDFLDINNMVQRWHSEKEIYKTLFGIEPPTNHQDMATVLRLLEKCYVGDLANVPLFELNNLVRDFSSAVSESLEEKE